MKSLLSGIILSLLLVSIFTATFNIQPVKASGTIYIRADGSVDPPTAPIQRDGDTYTFTANIYDRIVVQRSNITIDGAAYVLQGYQSGYGFSLSSVGNVTIKRTRVEEFAHGIYLNRSSFIYVLGNNITNNYYGIGLTESFHNTIQKNNITTNEYDGIYLSCSDQNYISENNIINTPAVSARGIRLYESSDNSIYKNNLTGNSNYGVYGTSQSNNNTFSENDLRNNHQGIYLSLSSDNKIYQNNIYGGQYGIYVEGVNHTIFGNEMLNTQVGVCLWESFNSIVSANNIVNGTSQGLWLNKSPNNTLLGNNVVNNAHGIILHSSSNNIIYGNNMTNNKGDGIFIGGSGNKIYHNNLINNTRQAYSATENNVWDDGYPSGGNYWSDYNGTDLFSGSHQNETGSDGIGDTLYFIDEYNEDCYPLMNPWVPPPTPDFSMTASPTSLIIQQGDLATSTLTIASMNGFDKPVQLTVSGAPTGVTTTLNPEQVTPPSDGSTTSTLTVSVATTATTGSYTLTVTGTSGTLTHSVDISLEITTVPPPANQPPVANAGVDYSVSSGDLVTFDGSTSEDPDGTIVSLQWDFGDDATAEGKIVSHRFRGAQNEPKTYTVTLTVEDNHGVIATDTAFVTVKPLRKIVDVGPGYFGVSCWMEATYNWVGTDEATGENLYIISKIETYSGGISGAYQLFILRRTSPPPSIPKLVWYIPLPTAPILRTYVTPFTPSVWQELWGEPAEITTLTFQEGTFQGIGVTDTSLMLIVATGTETGITLYYDAGLTKFSPSSPIVRLKSEELKELWELRDIIDLLNKIIGIIGSPCELRIYDSEGRVMGLVNGEIKEEIPGSAYANGTMLILYSNDTYRYEVVGMDQGTYKLLVISVENIDDATFTAIEIPSVPNAIHQYTIDWAALSQGQEGVTVKVDSDGDGVFELTFTSNSELTREEFMLQITPKEAFPLWIVGTAVAIIATASAAVAVFWRKRKQHVTKG